MRGKIIVIEGVDCSGKYSQSKMLYDRLKSDGIDVVLLSFPMYDTPTGKIIKGPFLGNSEVSDSFFTNGSSNVSPYVSSLYYAADRKYNIDRINEYLENGTNVILDRYTTSNMGHQASKLLNKEDRLEFFTWIEKLEYDLLSLPRPDICTVLNVPIEYVVKLEKNRVELDNNEKDIDYLNRSINAYLELSCKYNYKVIDCVSDNKLRSKNDINDELYKYVLDNIMR